jgi:hypothetical protein
MGTSQDSGEGGAGTSSDNQGILNTMTSRVKLNFKVLGVQVNYYDMRVWLISDMYKNVFKVV